ncbi:MAG: hypothetical protein ACRCTN_10825 [Carnobacterium maltaromaticum]
MYQASKVIFRGPVAEENDQEFNPPLADTGLPPTLLLSQFISF